MECLPLPADVVQQAQHADVDLPPTAALALGELHAEAAADAARAAANPAASAATGRLSGRAARQRHQLTPAQLRHSGLLWLTRYRNSWLEPEAHSAAAVAAATAADGEHSATVGAVAEAAAAGPARYWWARGRLLESTGQATEAAQAYQHCAEALVESGKSNVHA